MPEKEENLTVPLDTSGPGATVELPEITNETEKIYEAEEKNNEAIIKYDDKPDSTSTKPDEPSDVLDKKDEGETVTQKTSEESGDKPADNQKKVEEYSEGVQKRIAKLTKKMREAERQKDEAIAFARRLKQEKDHYEITAKSLDKNYAAEMEGRISSSLAAAQAKLSTARLNEDSKAEVEALTSISQLGYEQGKLAEIKTQHQMEEKAEKEFAGRERNPYENTALTPQPSPRDFKAEAWANKNEWFGTDNALTYTAFDLHRKLTEEEGMDPQSDEYYAEIDKRIRLDFPHKFDKSVDKQTSKPTQTVASATRSTKTGRREVRLTPSQVAIARKLGVPLEEYAKQLIKYTKEV